MTEHLSANLTLARKILLSAAAFAALGVPFVTGLLQAQTANEAKRFEVISVKPAAGEMHQVGIRIQPNGGLNITGMGLRELIGLAYDVRPFQISGGPSWMNTERYDITAKASTGEQRDFAQLTDAERRQAREEMNERIRHLLGDRFQLVVRKEQKESSAYALVQGPNGHKMKAAEAPTPGVRQFMRMGRGSMEAEGGALEMLTQSLARALGRPVLDKTGLKGAFNFKLEWTPDGNEAGPIPGGGGPPPAANLSGPSIFTAVQEQLGLKLESVKAPIDMIVIEKIEKPSAN